MTDLSQDTNQRPVLVIDFGAQYSQLIARRVREANIYSEVVPYTISAQELADRNPYAIILSGGPANATDADAPEIDAEIIGLGIPILGICYGFQSLAKTLGGTVSATDRREYGRTEVSVTPTENFLTTGGTTQQVWMSHSDQVTELPEGFVPLASTKDTPIAAFGSVQDKIFGVQWHPEVKGSEYGQALIEEFLFQVAGIEPAWNSENVIEEQVARIRAQVGSGKVLCALSGGVDSAVAAALVQKAVGDQLTCVFVDHGLLRAGEREQVEQDFVAATGIRLITVDASDKFLKELDGVTDPETKRKIIGREFIRTFEEVQDTLRQEDPTDPIRFLVQGTLYPDVVESGVGAGASNIKSHHNVGGLPEDIEFELVEPLRLLFKDEVRQIGRALGVPEVIVSRQPFPGPGLGIRIVGAVSRERLTILRAADAIVRQELTLAGLDEEIWQCPVVLLADVRSVGVHGDGRTYGHPIVLRPVSSEDAMTADWSRIPYEVLAKISNRITNEVDDVNRVVLDVTGKPPGTIEWE